MSVPSSMNDDSKLLLAKKWLEKISKISASQPVQAPSSQANARSRSKVKGQPRSQSSKNRSKSTPSSKKAEIVTNENEEDWVQLMLLMRRAHYGRGPNGMGGAGGGAVSQLLKNIPVATSEAILKKYGCMCVNKDFSS